MNYKEKNDNYLIASPFQEFLHEDNVRFLNDGNGTVRHCKTLKDK